VALGFGPFFAAQIVPQAVLRLRERVPDVQQRLVEGLRHATGPMVRDGTLTRPTAALARLLSDIGRAPLKRTADLPGPARE